MTVRYNELVAVPIILNPQPTEAAYEINHTTDSMLDVEGQYHFWGILHRTAGSDRFKVLFCSSLIENIEGN
jgi:hypothetical protein